MSMSDIALSFRGSRVRHIDHDGQRWLCARDVCACWGVTNRPTVTAAIGRLGDNQRDSFQMNTPGGRQAMTFITIGGAIKMALQSRKPAAEPFVDWVSNEVMVAVVTTGRYEAQPPAEDALILQAVGILQGRVEEAEKRAIAAESTVEQQAPFVAFAEQVRASTGDMTISTACKHLDLIATGANGIFTWLRRNKWIAAKYRDGVNQPNLTATSRGYMRLVERCYPDSETGEIVSKPQLLLTASGVVWLSEVAPQRCRRCRTAGQLTLPAGDA